MLFLKSSFYNHGVSGIFFYIKKFAVNSLHNSELHRYLHVTNKIMAMPIIMCLAIHTWPRHRPVVGQRYVHFKEDYVVR